MWEPQWPALTERFRVVRLDLRGYGQTPLPAVPYSNARDVLRLLDELGLERAALVGNSLGGRVALDVATLARGRVTRLALLAAGLRDWEWSEAIRSFGAEEDEAVERGDLDEATEINVRMWLSPGAPPDVRDLVRTMQRHAFDVDQAAYAADPQPGPVEEIHIDLARIAVPVLVVVGAHDVPDFLQIGELLERELPDARLVVLDTGHLVSMEAPDETTELLLDFLEM